ncbi:hypothetical protein P691DRAFT_811985 [Macrolepiota fuliginosa MF-IS2]|uniref:Uncharacterized protein n=1 Tax=Macrolepiota fuliginosa MF-IS2 TaxID=1400762 RepID=A0A9P5XFF3_9AGAR|nr:hypothetical protein P691DRAFT_811985 [Macrolepiota fuliginosa MF-IS2]
MSTAVQTSAPDSAAGPPSSRKRGSRKTRQPHNNDITPVSQQPEDGNRASSSRSTAPKQHSAVSETMPTSMNGLAVISPISTGGAETQGSKTKSRGPRWKRGNSKGKTPVTIDAQPLPSTNGREPPAQPPLGRTREVAMVPVLPADQEIRTENDSKSESEVEEEEAGEIKAGLTPAQQAAKAAKRQARLLKNKKKKEEHYQLVLAAAETTISALRKHGISCAAFGSLAGKLYGEFRHPKDVDLLVLQPSPPPDSETPLRTAEELKDLMLDSDPRHFYLKLPRDPEAPYRILYYREEYLGPDCKVDILTPGTMHLPNLLSSSPSPTSSNSSGLSNDTLTPVSIPPDANPVSLATNIASPPPHNHLTTISGIPLVPFSLLLLHKLQGWTDHRDAPEKHKQRKQGQDAADVRRLLAMDKMINELKQTQPWADTELFSEEFQELTKGRVKEYCKEFPAKAASWQMLGFETA